MTSFTTFKNLTHGRTQQAPVCATSEHQRGRKQRIPTLSCCIKQNTLGGRKGQDGAETGHTLINGKKVSYMVVFDGHGRGENSDNVVKILRNISWNKVLKNQNFHEIIQEKLADVPTNSCGSTLSVVLIHEDRFEVFWIGDSLVKIYSDDKTVWEMMPHNETNPSEIIRMKERKTPVLKVRRGKKIWRSSVIGDDTIDMVQGYLFNFGTENILNMSHSLGHRLLTGNFISKKIIQRNKNQNYKIVVASDGLWDMVHPPSHAAFLASPENHAEQIVQFAERHWRQKWKYREDTESQFPPRNIDDIGVATWHS